MTILVDLPFSGQPMRTSARRHAQSAIIMTMASPGDRASAKGVAVKQVAAIMTAAMMMTKATAVMAVETTATMIALAIPIGAMITAKAAQTIRSVAAAIITTMTGNTSPITIMMLIMSRRMTPLQ